MDSSERDAELSIADASTAYLSRVTECVRRLDDVFADRDGAVSRVVELESACDDAGRDVLGRIGVASPTFRSVYLQAGDLAEFYTRVDEVANCAEAVGLDCRAMNPDLDPVRAELRAMIADAAEAAEHLETAAEHYLAGDADAEVLASTAAIRDRESACDDRRDAAVSDAFDSLDTADALVVRELVHGADRVIDAVEDAADHLEFMVAVAP